MRRRCIRKTAERKSDGLSLTELLVGSILMAVSIAAVAEIMSLCVLANTKLFRQFDAQAGANFALDRIKGSIRMSSEVLPYSDLFGSVKVLSPQTLILSQPVHFLAKNNDPSDALNYDPGAEQNLKNGLTIPGASYTVVYEVVPDDDAPGEFKMLCTTRGPQAVFDETSALRLPIEKQTMCRGIIGPLEPGAAQGSLPKVFSFIARNPLRMQRLDLIKESTLYDFGVSRGINLIGIDLEIRKGADFTAASTSGGAVEVGDKVIGVHTEAFLRLPTYTQGKPEEAIYEP